MNFGLGLIVAVTMLLNLGVMALPAPEAFRNADWRRNEIEVQGRAVKGVGE